MGAIIGKVFENADEGYFADFHGGGTSSGNFDTLTLSNIVAVNLWDPLDFDNLYNF